MRLPVRTDSPAVDGYWTPGAVVRRVAEVLRDQGVRMLVAKVLGELVYRRYVLYEFALDRPIRTTAARVPLEYALLTDADADEYVDFRHGATADEVRARLATGHRCFLARSRGEIVHARWYATDRVFFFGLGYEVAAAPGSVIGYAAFTAPEARGQGIAPAARMHALEALRADGYTREYAVIDPANRPAVRVVDKVGYRRVGSLAVLRLGARRRPIVRLVPGALPPGAAPSPARR
jgi:GNAT superfamily N-acetyltransferase